jgi:hypothetical protein
VGESVRYTVSLSSGHDVSLPSGVMRPVTHKSEDPAVTFTGNLVLKPVCERTNADGSRTWVVAARLAGMGHTCEHERTLDGQACDPHEDDTGHWADLAAHARAKTAPFFFEHSSTGIVSAVQDSHDHGGKLHGQVRNMQAEVVKALTVPSR